ncbi:MAG: HPF/RaiA family ribosome-associated protein [Anaerolineae bacterium]
MSQTDFSFEFLSEIDQPIEELRAEVEQELRDLAEDHTDMIGASVALEELTGQATPHRYQARIVVYMRPSDIAAVEKAPTPVTAVEQAMESIERQIREDRQKLRERWKQP